MSGTFTRRVAVGASMLCAGATLLSVPPSAHADTLLIESFTNGTVANAADWVAGGSGGSEQGWPAAACLTAGSSTAQTPIKGCAASSPDASGSGALRLSPATNDDAGFTLYNHALPTSGGLDITFDQAQYGGSGADGIGFFLVDGAVDLTSPGGAGGGLGYSAGNTNGASYTPGIDGGLLGIGIDKWGNFSSSWSSGTGCAAGTGVGSAGPGQTPNVVAIRGEGSGTAGYCWLGASADLGSTLSGADRASATVQVHIVIDPAGNGTRHVTVSLNGTQVLQIPAPAALLGASSFKFGFSGSTGAVTDIHEVWDLSINSVIPVPTTTSSLAGTGTTVAPTSVAPTTTVPGAPAPATPVDASPTYTG